MRANAPFQRLRWRWLLVLQIMILLLIALAIARPRVQRRALARGKRRRLSSADTILMIDTSGSMRAVDQLHQMADPVWNMRTHSKTAAGEPVGSDRRVAW